MKWFEQVKCRLGWHAWGSTERVSVFGQDYHDTRVCGRCGQMETPLSFLGRWAWTHAAPLKRRESRQ